MPGDFNTAQGRILAGLRRLATFQYPDGLFAIWCGGQPGVDITARVAHRLLGLRGLPFPASREMLRKAGKVLLREGYRDNALLALDPGFAGPMASVEDAVACYFASGNGQQKAALAFLRNAVRHEGNLAFWNAQHAWGGHLEATADGARVMYAAGDDLFVPAFNYVGSKMVNGMLYSTADTRALVELLASLKLDPTRRALIDGQEVALGDVTIGKEVTALSAHLVVRADEEIEIDHLAPRADFQFSIKPDRLFLRVGERMKIVITPQERTIAPLTRLFLPGTLALLRGGANAQTAYLPIERDELAVEAIAVRPGRGKLYAMVHDMYDAGKVGTAPGVEITVE